MRKYNYFVDNVQVPRNMFFKQLRIYSHRPKRVATIAGWCGVDVMEFDEKKYKEHVRDISNGYVVLVMNGTKSKAFKRTKV